ncbi:hypothetical protein JMJ56_26695 [Belnapia sp. T18]|uniref:DUF927 domain-containing protein n=1 Tax=Belnapia arida TaxID=2804533 RepID=A0ABS1UA96_9PROT|nr:hypothetical protein [Belnapia arida]MBL6081584.1 hypothetical protein [Belnapia arida]
MSANARTGCDVPRRCIRIVPGQLPGIVDQAEQALLESGLGLYQRGSLIVRPGIVLITIAGGKEVAAQRILEVGEHALVEAMTAAAEWERYYAQKRKWTATDAPIGIARAYLKRVGRWKLPVLAGIIDAPTLRPDGSILSTSGYDRATGLLLATGETVFPSVPDQPTKAEAAAALQVLSPLVASFPFVGASSRAVAFSAILTACIRSSLPAAPMHAFSAPTAGSGKSKLVDLASVIATGREAGVISQGRTEEELEKRLGALLLAGDRVIAIDNCETPLGGEFLCCALTQPVVRARILGRSKAPELPSDAFITATGNNLVLVGDLTRRAVLCRLDPKEERPELRKFSSDPIAIVKADRGRYLVAALTILRAYHVAGRPERPDPLGSYEIWSDWVRGALLWLGEADPVATMEGVRESDPKLDALLAVLEQWEEVIGRNTVSVRDVIDRATQQVTALGMGYRTEFRYPDFREALLAVAGEGGAVNSKRLGKWLASNQDRVVQSHRLIRVGVSGGIARWRIEAVTEASADDGAD